eukprot:s102_g12.t1
MVMAILPWVLLSIPIAAIRDGLKSDSLALETVTTVTAGQTALWNRNNTVPSFIEGEGDGEGDEDEYEEGDAGEYEYEGDEDEYEEEDEEGDCEEEANKTRALLKKLGYTGPLDGHHCDWPGIACYSDSWEDNCKVESLDCDSCDGQLPERIALTSLQSVKLTSPKLTGDIKSFAGLENLLYLELPGTRVEGNLNALAQLKCWTLDLSETSVVGNLNDVVVSKTWCKLLVHLRLSGTAVTGDFSKLTECISIREVDLSNTAVCGSITAAWRGRCGFLHTLKLQSSRVQFLPDGEEVEKLKDHRSDSLLPNLRELDLSNCAVNSTVEDLLLTLAMSPLTSIQATVSGLYGDMPKLIDVEATVDGKNQSNFTYPLAKSLLVIDLSSNNVSKVVDLPVQPHLGRISLQENGQLNVEPAVLIDARKQQIVVDLSGVTVGNEEEVLTLLSEGAVQITEMFSFRNESAGYGCKDLVGTVKVTPSIFLPQKLCQCLPGWHGKGVACHMCPTNSFINESGQETCHNCPQNSTAPEGSTKLTDCKCTFGSLHDGLCACDMHHALQNGDCTLCVKLHLQCEYPGSFASTALPDVQHMRLKAHAEKAHKCLAPAESIRCPGGHKCGEGYDGILCSSCADGFWATGGKCQRCAETKSTSIGFVVGVAAVGLVLGALVYRRGREPQAPRVSTAISVKHLLQKLEALQLTTTELQNLLNLQCSFDAQTVRTLAALSSPLAPLFLLLCCVALEFYRAGLGVSAALKMLTLLFIGGASSTAELLSCQSEDGDGEPLGDEFAFRKSIRDLGCYDRDGVGFWVDVVGYGSTVAYAVLIPLFLAGLMVRQHFALQGARLFAACVERKSQTETQQTYITLRLHALDGELSKKTLQKRLLAAAAANMAVDCRGKMRIQLHEGYVTISSHQERQEDMEDVEIDVIKAAVDAETSRERDVLRSRRLTEMLTERIMLDEAEEAEDRLLLGSKPLLLKYTLCQDLGWTWDLGWTIQLNRLEQVSSPEDVWMDVAMKLFSVALVSCVSMADAWKWAIAFSLGMAVLVGACQPYMQPQVGHLQSLSCFCLALASVAFVYDLPTLARATLLMPVLLLLWQARSPDCTESLAERNLWMIQIPRVFGAFHKSGLVSNFEVGLGTGEDRHKLSSGKTNDPPVD